MRVNFQELKVYGRKSAKCCDCGKRVRRQKKFWQTLNPFNRNAQGQPKTSKEVYAELRAEADAWEAKPIRCAACVLRVIEEFPDA